MLRPRWTWSACRRPCPTPRSWPTGSAPSGAPPRRSSRNAGRSSCTTCTSSATRAPTASTSAHPGGRPAQPRGRRPSTPKTLRHPGMRGRPRGRLFTPRRAEIVELLGEHGMLPGDLLHLQPGGLRRRGGPVPTRRPAAHRDPTSAARSGPSPSRTSRCSRDEDLRVLEYGPWLSRAGGRVRRPPRRPGAPLQGGGRGVLRRRPGEGGVRHRDALARHQHAGPLGGHREADQVHRRAPRVPDPGEYTQLTGRAGRRGHRRSRLRRRPVVALRALRPGGRPGRGPHLRPDEQLPAHLQHGRQPGPPLPARRWPTTCSTCPSPSTGRTATWCASKPSWSAPRPALDDARAAATCERGDVEEYRRLIRASEETARQRPSMSVGGGRRPGAGPPRRRSGRAGRQVGGRVAVLSTTRRKGRRHPAAGHHRRPQAGLPRPRGLPGPAVDPWPGSACRLPTPRTTPASRRQVASSLVAARLAVGPDGADGRPGHRVPRWPGTWRGALAMSQAAAAASHPVAGCPDARAPPAGPRPGRPPRNGTWSGCERRVKGRIESLARQFDRVLRVLEAWGYVDGWALTERGERLARLYHEADLLIAECIGAGPLRRPRAPAELAGLVSVFTFEARGQGEPTAWFPTPGCADAGRQVERLAKELNEAEDDAGSPADPVARPRLRGTGPRLGRRRGAGRRSSRRRRSPAGTSSAT